MADDIKADVPTRREQELLKTIYELINQTKQFPDNETLCSKMNVELPWISKMKSRLSSLGYLSADKSKLTSKAINFLRGTNELLGFRSIVSTYLPLAGEVSAGRGRKYDDLAVFMDGDLSSASTVAVPNMANINSENAVVLKVKGVSMEAAKIFDGDLVIVELRNDYKENQIVVAEYLSEEDEKVLDEDIIDSTEVELIGYTLKVFRGIDTGSDRTHYRLGRLRDYGSPNPYEIKTRIFRVLGKVVGVYREIFS